MKKITLLFTLISILSTLSISAQVTIEGDPYGGNPYPSITDAIAASTNVTDVILISGTVTESITIDRGITLRGTDPTTDIIQANAAANTASTRVIAINPGSYTVNIENLKVRHGNAPGTDNGGGIFADQVTGTVNLTNLIIENNNTAKNGGGLALEGTNANIIGCTITKNTSSLDGGGAILLPKNATNMDSTVNIEQSLIEDNSGRNGGGIFINGNPVNPMTQSITVNVENSTISNNNAFATGGSSAGGGSILSRSVNSPGNVTLKLVHATFYNNTHAAGLLKGGIQFLAPNGSGTNFSAYNSIVVGNDDVSELTGSKAINFANTTTTNVVNCIFGGTNEPPTIVSDPVPNTNNNQAGKTATEAGLTGTLTSDGGNTQVIPLAMSSTAVDYCTVAIGETITIDQRGYARNDGTNDAGAYEYGATTLSVADNEFDNGLKLYPNPAREFVTISSLKKIKQVKVYSILGVLENTFYNQNELNISGLSKGVHLLSIEADDSSRSTRRLVIY